MNPAKRREIFERFRAANPNPTTELKYTTPFELLVAVVLSAQATDKSVNQATDVLYKKYNTPEKIAKLGVAGLEEYKNRIGCTAPRRRTWWRCRSFCWRSTAA